MTTFSFLIFRTRINVLCLALIAVCLVESIQSKFKSVADILIEINELVQSAAEQSKGPIKIIGVMAQPVSNLITKHLMEAKDQVGVSENDIKQMTYFPESYVKWIRQKNTLVVPIDSRNSIATIRIMLKHVNALLIPGGKTTILVHEDLAHHPESGIESRITKKLTPYAMKVLSAIEHLKERQDSEKIKIPIFGTCLGYELLLLQSAFSQIEFDEVDNFKKLMPLDSYETEESSPIGITRFLNLKNSISQEKVFFFNHKYALTVHQFNDSPNLQNDYDIVATATVQTKDGPKIIVAAIQHKKYPIYGVQFHPEKNEFEPELNLPHSLKTLKFLNGIDDEFYQNIETNASNECIQFWKTRTQSIQTIKAYDYGGFKEVFIFNERCVQKILI